MQTPTHQTLCGICGQHSAIYTCPRCATRTCSLPCSASHKTLQSCSGERDKTAYVPMNKYGWGTMVNDYVYLEEVGRKAAEWGNDIAKGGFFASAAAAARGRGVVTQRNAGRGKRDILKMQLGSRDIEMEMLPPGMEKRRRNQSTWDVRKKALLITLELVFHPARDPFSPSSANMPTPFNLLTHRNNLNSTLLDVVRKHITELGQREAVPSWVQSLAKDGEDATSLYLIAQHDTSPHRSSKMYYKVDVTQTLAACLCHKSFVEYPTIEVWRDGEFSGIFIDLDGSSVHEDGPAPPAKRRRLDKVGGRKVIKGLLDSYKSDGEQEEDNILSMLHHYASEGSGTGDEGTAEEYTEKPDVDDEEVTTQDFHDIFEAEGDDAASDQIACLEGDDVDWVDSSEDEGGVEALERLPKQQETKGRIK